MSNFVGAWPLLSVEGAVAGVGKLTSAPRRMAAISCDTIPLTLAVAI